MEKIELSLNDKMHLTLGKFRTLIRYSSWVVVLVLFLSYLVIDSQYDVFDEINKYGTIKDTDDCQVNEVCYVFTPFSDDFTFTEESITMMYSRAYDVVEATVGIITISAGLGIWLVLKGRAVNNELKELKSQYIRQSYFMNFEMSVPQGNTRAAKFFNTALNVFPELKSKYEQTKKKGKKYNYEKKFKIGKYELDMMLPTTSGDIYVKFFEKLGFEDLKEAAKKVGGEFNENDRLICIANRFEMKFDDKNFEEKMDEIDRKFRLDLIQEDEKGYTVIWID